MEGSLVQICIPIFNWTKWIGLELDRGSLPNILYSLIMMINTIVSNVAHQQCLLSSTIQDGEDGLIGRLIESCNAFAFTVGIHLAFFVTNRTQWNLVFKMLKDIQIGPEFVKKIPSASKTINIIGNALILWELCFIGVEFYFFLGSDLSAVWQFSGLMAKATTILPFSIIVLFFELSITTSLAFSNLDWEIKEIGQMTEHHSTQPVRLKLDHWRQKHAHALQTVGQINQCFGSIILIATANCFVAFIIYSYKFLKSVQRGSNDEIVNFFLHLMNFFIIMTMITFAPNKIKTEAVKVTKSLRKLYFNDTVSQYQINSLKTQTSQALPVFTAINFFDVDLQLYPTLIGTTLTYLIILFQSTS